MARDSAVQHHPVPSGDIDQEILEVNIQNIKVFYYDKNAMVVVKVQE